VQEFAGVSTTASNDFVQEFYRSLHDGEPGTVQVFTNISGRETLSVWKNLVRSLGRERTNTFTRIALDL
jgi:hypothetical protein